MAKLVVIEGTDGAGKATQTKLLTQRLLEAGLKVASISFPMYGRGVFGDEVARYLNGEFGELNSIDPKLVSLLYSLDRFEHRNEIASLMHHHDIVLSDRYVPSNIAHQTAKCRNASEAKSLRDWIENVEYSILSVPRPDVVIFLDVPIRLSFSLIEKKAARTYTSKKRDLHEQNYLYLQRVYKAFVELSSTPNWKRIKCYSGRTMRSPLEINNEIVRSLTSEFVALAS